MSDQRPDDTVLHQREIENLIEEGAIDVAEGGAVDGLDNEQIEDLVPITGGEVPTEAEHNLVVAAVNDILAALRNSKVLPLLEEE